MQLKNEGQHITIPTMDSLFSDEELTDSEDEDEDRLLRPLHSSTTSFRNSRMLNNDSANNFERRHRLEQMKQDSVRNSRRCLEKMPETSAHSCSNMTEDSKMTEDSARSFSARSLCSQSSQGDSESESSSVVSETLSESHSVSENMSGSLHSLTSWIKGSKRFIFGKATMAHISGSSRNMLQASASGMLGSSISDYHYRRQEEDMEDSSISSCGSYMSSKNQQDVAPKAMEAARNGNASSNTVTTVPLDESMGAISNAYENGNDLSNDLSKATNASSLPDVSATEDSTKTDPSQRSNHRRRDISERKRRTTGGNHRTRTKVEGHSTITCSRAHSQAVPLRRCLSSDSGQANNRTRESRRLRRTLSTDETKVGSRPEPTRRRSRQKKLSRSSSQLESATAMIGKSELQRSTRRQPSQRSSQKRLGMSLPIVTNAIANDSVEHHLKHRKSSRRTRSGSSGSNVRPAASTERKSEPRRRCRSASEEIVSTEQAVPTGTTRRRHKRIAPRKALERQLSRNVSLLFQES